jgi:hypothetical protein
MSSSVRTRTSGGSWCVMVVVVGVLLWMCCEWLCLSSMLVLVVGECWSGGLDGLHITVRLSHAIATTTRFEITI